MSSTRQIVRPFWWDDFLAEVRKTGEIGESLVKLDKSDRAHARYTSMDDDLKQELDDAKREGVLAAKKVRVRRVLAEYDKGIPLAEALKACDEKSARWHQLVTETGLEDERDEVTKRWRQKRRGYREAIEWLDVQYADLLEYYASVDDPAELRTALVETVDTVRAMLAASNMTQSDMAASRGAIVRDAVVRAAGQGWEETDGYPPFLEHQEV